MKTDKLCIDDYVINLYDNSYIKLDAITNNKVGYHRNGCSTHLSYARRAEIEPIEMSVEFLSSLGIFEATKYNDAIYQSEDKTVFIGYSGTFGSIRIKFEYSEADVFFKCKYFHTFINTLKCLSEVHTEANKVLSDIDNAINNLISNKNEKA